EAPASSAESDDTLADVLGAFEIDIPGADDVESVAVVDDATSRGDIEVAGAAAEALSPEIPFDAAAFADATFADAPREDATVADATRDDATLTAVEPAEEPEAEPASFAAALVPVAHDPADPDAALDTTDLDVDLLDIF